MGQLTRLAGSVPRPIQVALFAVALFGLYMSPVMVAPSIPVDPRFILGVTAAGSVVVPVSGVYTDAITTRAVGGFLAGSLVGWLVGSSLLFTGSSLLLALALTSGFGLLGGVLARR